MTEIRSAWEIALERTKDVAPDKQALQANTYKTEGKKAASKFFADEETDLKELLKGYDNTQLVHVREGLLDALLANLKLPADELALTQSRRAGRGLYAVIKDQKRLEKLLNQMQQFLEEYLEERKRLIQAVEQQYEPILRRKEEELAKQMGARVKLDPAMDPEYNKLLRQNLAHLEERYNEVLEQVKEEITRMAGK
jgi:hypothetical protein